MHRQRYISIRAAALLSCDFLSKKKTVVRGCTTLEYKIPKQHESSDFTWPRQRRQQYIYLLSTSKSFSESGRRICLMSLLKNFPAPFANSKRSFLIPQVLSGSGNSSKSSEYISPTFSLRAPSCNMKWTKGKPNSKFSYDIDVHFIKFSNTIKL